MPMMDFGAKLDDLSLSSCQHNDHVGFRFHIILTRLSVMIIAYLPLTQLIYSLCYFDHWYCL
jgi:hypothetical protein